jgi:small subunit ribosomal protein S11e
MADHQTERAFLKQPTIFQGKAARLGKKVKKSDLRFVREVGLGFKTPREAIDGHYIDHKCPFTGAVSIRGRIFKGVVKSTKMTSSIVVRRDYLHFIPKYQRYEKRHRNISAHVSPCFRIKEGDVATIGECRPLSKTIRFNVLKVQPIEPTQVKRFNPF